LRFPVALVILPKDEVPNVAAGFPKFVWLNSANVSNRNWKRRRSFERDLDGVVYGDLAEFAI
jgi:hypothetical protein